MIELISLDYDARLRAYCVNARCTYSWYIDKTVAAEENLTIQRSIIKGSKAYATLRADLKRGCLLPPIVLAAKNIAVPQTIEAENPSITDKNTETEILEQLYQNIEGVLPENIYIIDGLQRTNAIRQTLEELPDGLKVAFLENRIRIELWLNIPFGALAYRMLLLNAGQKPMSIKHQVEILSMRLQEELSSIPGIRIFSSLEGRRRTQKGQFQLAKLAQAFQAWLQGQPNIDLRNLVMEQLLAEAAIETLGTSLKGERPAEERDAFKEFVEWLVKIDCSLPDGQLEFLSNETVLQGIAAAVGAAERNAVLHDRMLRARTALLEQQSREPNGDPLAIAEFEALRKGIDPAKANVGQATRDMVFRAFQEHFISDGTKLMHECWRFAAGR